MFGRDKSPKIDYKKQRQKALFKNKAEDVVDRISAIKKYIFIFIGLLILAGLVVLFNNDQIFQVQAIEVVGVTRIDPKDVLTLLDEYKGKNILKVRPAEIEQKVKEKFGEVIDVYVSKDIEGTIKLDIVESTPVVVVISSDSITLLNNRAMVVGTLVAPKLELTEPETTALKGQLTVDDPIVKKRFEEDPANAELEWSKATKEDKQKYITSFQYQANDKINSYFEQAKSIVTESVYKDLVRILDRNNLKDEITGKSLEFVLKIQELILKIPLNINNIEYRTGDTFIFHIDSGKQLYFYPRRAYLDQIRDLNVLISSGEYNNLSIIDFRTEKYSGI